GDVGINDGVLEKAAGIGQAARVGQTMTSQPHDGCCQLSRSGSVDSRSLQLPGKAGVSGLRSKRPGQPQGDVANHEAAAISGLEAAVAIAEAAVFAPEGDQLPRFAVVGA